MGNNRSQDDTKRLLDEEDIKPIFEELNLVLIGSHSAGKNTIANAIFGKRVFTFWTSFRHVHIKKTCTVSGTKINLARIPGWRGDLSRQTKREIIHCVQTLYRTGPHAVLLVLKVDSVLSETTIRTLESLLTVELWKHTIVVFTDGEKLGHHSIEDYIISEQLQPLIDKCGQRYFVIQANDSNQIIATIEEFILRKKSATFFKLSAKTEMNTIQSDWEVLVERINIKISSIKTFKKSFENKRYKHSMKEQLESKDAEIQRLQAILREKENEIKRLRSRTEDPEPDLYRRIEKLEHQLHMMSNELEGKETENQTLKQTLKEKDAVIEEQGKELEMWRNKAIDWKTREDHNTSVHENYCHELSQTVSAASRKSLIQIQQKVFPSKGSTPHSWSDTLPRVLEMLSDDQLKKMKYYMWWNPEYKISRSLIEKKDRVELADQMQTQWDTLRGVLITRDVLKKIPHNNDDTIELLDPFLKTIGETW